MVLDGLVRINKPRSQAMNEWYTGLPEGAGWKCLWGRENPPLPSNLYKCICQTSLQLHVHSCTKVRSPLQLPLLSMKINWVSPAQQTQSHKCLHTWRSHSSSLKILPLPCLTSLSPFCSLSHALCISYPILSYQPFAPYLNLYSRPHSNSSKKRYIAIFWAWKSSSTWC